MINPLPLIQLGTSFLVGAGTGTVVSQAVKQFTPTNIKTLQQVSVKVAGFALAGAAGATASAYTNEAIENGVLEAKTLMKTYKDAKSNR